MRYHTLIVFGDDLTVKMNQMEPDYVFHFIIPFNIVDGIVHQYRLIYSDK